MKTVKRFRFVAPLLVLIPFLLFSEGTKQLMPTSDSKGQLCIDKFRNDFAFFDGLPEFRLNISVANTSESIRFGIGKVTSDYDITLIYRIKDPSGNVVFGPLPVPESGQGYINSYSEAEAGPFPLAGGYDYLELEPLSSGSYYMEFYYPPNNSGTYEQTERQMIEFFDITVVNAARTAMNGRVWSRAWQIWSEEPVSPPTDHRFYGKMMILSDDSIVTMVNGNGFIGGSFSFASNMTGCGNTGNFAYDRKSRQGFYTYPKYKVFLNDPDSNLFPTAKLVSGIVQPVTVTPDCSTGGADFGIKVVKDGTVELLVEINPTSGADPEDVQIISNVLANPGGSGYNIITWDGNDNYGNPVANGTALILSAKYLSGLTHLPIFDIEYNDNGYIVEQIRPPGGQLQIFWDDSDIQGGSYDTVAGCSNPNGCHIWDNDIGNDNTINSWWYVTISEVTSVPFISERRPGPLSLSGSEVYCIGKSNLEYSVENEPNSTVYNWSYSGTGASITGSGTTITLSFGQDATAGTLSVYGHNDLCGDGPVSSMAISIYDMPVVTLGQFPEICYTAPGFELSGGLPEGGIYSVDGTITDSLFPYKETAGIHSIVYTYSAASGCKDSDTSEILLRTGPDCEAAIFFPNAFTPDKDGLNDEFKPVSQNIYDYHLYIYDRWGELIFSTPDPSTGWDGTYNGWDCPAGVFVYKSIYRLSLRADGTSIKCGAVMLLR